MRPKVKQSGVTFGLPVPFHDLWDYTDEPSSEPVTYDASAAQDELLAIIGDGCALRLEEPKVSSADEVFESTRKEP